MKFKKLHILLVAIILSLSFSSFHAKDRKNVLVLHSYDSSYEWTENINKGLLSVLDSPEMNLYVEYLDLIRQPYSDEYLNKVEALLVYKYKNNLPQVVVVTDDYAFDFIIKKRERIFGNIPVVFCGVNNFSKEMLKGQKNITGINETMSIKETVELALGFSKNVKKIAVIAGDRIPEKKNLEDFKKVIKKYEKNYEVLYLNDRELDEIEKELSKLTSQDIIFYLSYIRSAGGVIYKPDYVLKRMVNSTKAGIYVLQDYLVKFNVLGGKVVSGIRQGEYAGKLVHEILKGKKPDDIPIIMESPNVYQFNGKELIKRGIPTSALPKNSVIVKETPEQIKADWLARVKKSAFDYNLFKNHGTVMLIIDPETGSIIDANNSAYLYYGYSSLTDMKIQQINTLTEEQVKEEMQKAKQERRNFFNFRHRLANGSIRDVEVYSYPIKFHGEPLLFSIIFDVTEKIALEKEFRKRQELKIILLSLIVLLTSALILVLLFYIKRKKKYEQELLEKNRSLEKAREEIKILSGIIPICSHCKKIRDDKGYWNQLEKYISEHSEAMFSHSLCPDCVEKYYKDYIK